MSDIIRLASALGICFWAATAHGQIVNGSFEDANGFSFAGWSFGGLSDAPWPWDVVNPIQQAAPGYGSWSAAPHSSQVLQGPFWLRQQVGPLLSGDIYTVSFWVRCPVGYTPCACLYFNGADIATVCENEPEWTQVTLTDTVTAEGNQTVEFRTFAPGSMNVNPIPAYFDGVEFSVIGHVSVNEATSSQPEIRFDAESGTLRVKSQRKLKDLRLLDVTGRTIRRFGPVQAGQAASFGVPSVHSGLYLVIIEGSEGHHVVKLYIH